MRDLMLVWCEFKRLLEYLLLLSLYMGLRIPNFFFSKWLLYLNQTTEVQCGDYAGNSCWCFFYSCDVVCFSFEKCYGSVCVKSGLNFKPIVDVRLAVLWKQCEGEYCAFSFGYRLVSRFNFHLSSEKGSVIVWFCMPCIFFIWFTNMS